MMQGSRGRCAAAADEHGRPSDCVLGANMSGFARAADAMLAPGVIWNARIPSVS